MIKPKKSLKEELNEMRRDLNILMQLYPELPEIQAMKSGKSIDDMRREEAARLTIRTGDKSYIINYQKEKLKAEGRA